MDETKDWEDLFIGSALNGKADGVRQALELGLPVNELVFDRGTYTALHYAVDRRTKPAVVAALLEAGADVNARAAEGGREGVTPLMVAARRGRVDLVRQLLAAGADLHALDATGTSALASACWGGKTGAYAEVVRELLAAGAEPDAEALAAAAEYGSPETVRLLVAGGAEVNGLSRWGTALLRAIDAGRADTSQALLAAGADPAFRLGRDVGSAGWQVPYAGKTALELARERGLTKLIPLLEAAAAGEPVASLMKPPAPPGDITEVWQRLEKSLKVSAPEIAESLRRGTTEGKLSKLEALLGLPLPVDLRQSYRRHNGQKDETDGIFPEGFAGLDAEFCLLSVDETAGEWEEWKELRDDGDFDGDTSTPDAGVRSDWWHPGWVPVAVDGAGDSVCVDLAPAEGGTVGQVILMDHEGSDRPRLAGSWTEFLALLADHYQGG